MDFHEDRQPNLDSRPPPAPLSLSARLSHPSTRGVAASRGGPARGRRRPSTRGRGVAPAFQRPDASNPPLDMEYEAERPAHEVPLFRATQSPVTETSQRTAPPSSPAHRSLTPSTKRPARQTSPPPSRKRPASALVKGPTPKKYAYALELPVLSACFDDDGERKESARKLMQLRAHELAELRHRQPVVPQMNVMLWHPVQGTATFCYTLRFYPKPYNIQFVQLPRGCCLTWTSDPAQVEAHRKLFEDVHVSEIEQRGMQANVFYSPLYMILEFKTAPYFIIRSDLVAAVHKYKDVLAQHKDALPHRNGLTDKHHGHGSRTVEAISTLPIETSVEASTGIQQQSPSFQPRLVISTLTDGCPPQQPQHQPPPQAHQHQPPLQSQHTRFAVDVKPILPIASTSQQQPQQQPQQRTLIDVNVARFPLDIQPYFDSGADLRTAVTAFLRAYFDRFDRFRSSLLDFYDAQAIFSLHVNTMRHGRPLESVQGTVPIPFAAGVIAADRGMISPNSRPALSAIHVANIYSRFPPTIHSEQEYEFDAFYCPNSMSVPRHIGDVNGTLVFVNVFGNYTEFITKAKRSFTRTLILRRAPPDSNLRFAIVNEQVYLRHPTQIPKHLPLQASAVKQETPSPSASVADDRPSPVPPVLTPVSATPTQAQQTAPTVSVSMSLSPVEQDADHTMDDQSSDDMDISSDDVQIQQEFVPAPVPKPVSVSVPVQPAVFRPVAFPEKPTSEDLTHNSWTQKTVTLYDRLSTSPGSGAKLAIISRFACVRQHDYAIVSKRGDLLACKRPIPHFVTTLGGQGTVLYDNAAKPCDVHCGLYIPETEQIVLGLQTRAANLKRLPTQLSIMQLNSASEKAISFVSKTDADSTPHQAKKEGSIAGVSSICRLSSSQSVQCITGGIDRKLVVWSLGPVPKVQHQIETKHTQAIATIAEGTGTASNTLVTGSLDSRLCLYDMNTASMTHHGKAGCGITGIRFSPKDNNLFAAERHRIHDQVSLFDLRTLNLRPDRLPTATLTLSFSSTKTLSQFSAGSFSPSGNLFSIGYLDRLVTWDLRTGSTLEPHWSRPSTDDSGIVQVFYESETSLSLLRKKQFTTWEA